MGELDNVTFQVFINEIILFLVNSRGDLWIGKVEISLFPIGVFLLNTVTFYYLRMIQANVGSNWLSCFRGEEIFIKVNDFHVTILLSNFLYLAMFDSGWVDHD
jgi:hypothetical protein